MDRAPGFGPGDCGFESYRAHTMFVMKQKYVKMEMMKRILLINFLFLFLFLVASPVLAGGTNCPTEGLVPCGTTDCPCEFCDFFVMLNRIVKFVMFALVPAVAVLMLIVGGIMFFFGGAKPDTLIRAKGIITSVIIGLVIIFCAWVVVNTVLNMSGLIESENLLKWYDINCPS